MSATPPEPPSGRTPNGGPAVIRRFKPADPLRRPEKKRQRRTPQPGASGSKINGLPRAGDGLSNPKPGQNTAKPPVPAIAHPQAAPLLTGGGTDASGFSSEPIGPYTDYPLVTTKRALMEGLRLHVARFSSKKPVDPTNESEFTRPVRLHRRDPRAPQAGGGGVGVKDEDIKPNVGGGVTDEKERERQEILRQEREAQRAENQKQIAPAANAPQKKASSFNNKKTQQAYDKDDDPEAAAEKKLKYEEALPWHLEDFDNKNTWVGNYESALSGTYAMLVMQPNQTIRVAPLEKWYKFTAKNHFKTLSIEEAESRMGKKVKEPRWFMDSQKEIAKRADERKKGNTGSKLFLGKDLGNEDGSNLVDKSLAASQQNEGVDDIDYEEDRFADDEENKLFEGSDDDVKEADERIKRDQLGANVFDLKEEKQYDKAEAEEKKKKEMEKKLGKGTRKALQKREKNYIYESDSDNPYEEKSESEDSEAEAARLKEEEKQKEEQKRAAAEKEKAKGKDSDKAASVTSSKGTDTPTGRPKHTDSLKRSSSNLKRPGSPNLSEASGTESARKKQKNKHPSSSQPTGRSTPKPGSRPISPVPPSSAPDSTRPQSSNQRKSSVIQIAVEPAELKLISALAPRPDSKRSRPTAGSGSDNELVGADMTDGGRKKKKIKLEGKEAEATGGEMSDGSLKKQKIKLRVGSPTSGTPQGSRAGSPEVGQGPQPRVPGTANGRASSPANRGPSDAPKRPVQTPTAEEIRAAIPKEGTTITLLLAHFKSRVGPRDPFIALVRANSKFVNGRMMPR